jgi:hypothetical protein
MNNLEKKLFNTEDWLSKHPMLIMVLLFLGIVLASYIE